MLCCWITIRLNCLELRNKHLVNIVITTCWQGMEYKNKIMKFSSRTLICVLADLFYFVYEKPVPPFCGFYHSKGPGKRGHIVADTLSPTQMFPGLPARATFVADTNFVSGTQKMFLILFRNILCPQQMFPSLRSP